MTIVTFAVRIQPSRIPSATKTQAKAETAILVRAVLSRSQRVASAIQSAGGSLASLSKVAASKATVPYVVTRTRTENTTDQTPKTSTREYAEPDSPAIAPSPAKRIDTPLIRSAFNLDRR